MKVDNNKIKLATTSDYAIKAANGESVPNGAIVDLKSLGSGNSHKFTAQQVDIGITSIALPVDFSSQITTVTVGGAGGDGFALGGALSLNFLRNSVDARITNIGATQSVTAGGKLSILTNDSSQSNSGTGGIGISPSGGAIGASISYNEISNKLISRIGSLDTTSTTEGNAGIISAAQIEVNTTASAKIYNFTVAGAGAGTFALGGSLSLNRIDNTVDAHIAGSSNITSTQGINIQAQDTSSNQSLSGQIAIGVGTAGVGVALAYNEINNTINAYVDRSTINTTNSGNLGITAKSNANSGTLAVGIAGGGTAGVAGSIAVNLMGNNVSAFINNSTVNVDGNVSLLADSTNSIGAIGGTLAVGGVAGIGGTVVVNTTNNKTKAYIAGKSSVSAKGNGSAISIKKWNTDENGTETSENINGLSVIATTNETVNTYAATAGVTPPTGGGSVGIGANIVVEVINDITEAYIDDSNINSLANQGKSVKVRAHNDTTIGNFGGTLGVGDVGIGADIPVSAIASQTRAYISDSDPTTYAVIFGATDVEVNALSREKLQTVAVGLGIGSYIGAAGVGAGTKSATTTEAYIKDANINSNGALKVLANSGVKLEIYGGALGGSLVAGGGGSFAVSLINNTTNAYLQGAVTNTSTVQVQADALAKMSNAIATAGGGGVVGIAGGVSVVETNSSTSAYISSSTRNSNVTATTGDVKVIANDTVDVNNGVGSAAAGGTLGVSASVDVITIKNTVAAYIGDNSTVTAQTNVNVEATGKKNIDSTVVAFGLAGGAAITGAVSVINIGTGSNSDASSSTSPVQTIIDGITSPTNGINGLSNNTNDTTATKAKNQTNSAYFTVSLAANPTTTGTTAYIGKNANVKANTGNITVIANETIDLDGSHPATYGQLVGGVSLGLYGSAGGSVGIINIGQSANAYVDAGATLAAGADITVNAKFTNNAFSRAYGGTGALGVGLGAQVAIITDNSTQLAYTSNQGITVNQANNFTVKAESDRTISTEAKGATVGAVAAGAAVAKTLVGGSTVAYIGNNAAIGQEVGKNVNNISVIANNFTTGKSDTLAVAAGIVGVGVDVNQTTINPTITATIGGAANLKITGNLNVSANSQADANVNSLGISAGGLTVSIVQPEASIASTINAAIGAGVVLSAGGTVIVEPGFLTNSGKSGVKNC